jgi:hypothetical protein
MGHFKRLYNSWQIFKTAESMKDETVMINHPALSIVGACTAQAFFEALRPADVEGGFANRAMLLPFEGFRRPPERDVPEGAEDPPPKLVEELKELLGPRPSILGMKSSDFTDGGGAPPVDPAQRSKIEWGSQQAKDAYYAFSKEVDGWQEKDKRKFELSMRAAENAERCSTIVAGGCFSSTVDAADIDWALRWSRVSADAADGGVKKYMHNYFEFPKFCEEVAERISQEGFMSNRDLSRAFRRNMKHGHELDKVLAHLVKEGRVNACDRKGPTGPTAQGYKIADEN